MTSIPLYLKIKSSRRAEEALFETVGDRGIIVNDKQYDFTKIYAGSNNTYQELIDTSDVCTSFIFMGPTGSGKTTMLKQVIHEKIHGLEGTGTEAAITAFEVSENRYIMDLLETPAKRKEYHSSCLESQLHRRRLNGNARDIIETVFRKRNTKKTAFNNQSSRSCLVVTFLYHDKRVNYIDLMGNEKYDRSLSLSNAFANTNMSSITQLLANKASSNGRSSNLITNLIFKGSSPCPGKINIILTVDPCGDVILLKSILNNIATLVKDFKLESSTTNRLDNTPKIPHYARPTISSLSPTRIVPTVSPLRKLSPTPSKFRMIPSSNKLNTAPKLLSSRNTHKFQTPTRNAFIVPAKTSLPYRASHLTNNFYEIQINSFKKTIKDMEVEISEFKHEHKEILQNIASENLELISSLTTDNDSGSNSLKGELNALIGIKVTHDELLKEKNVLNGKINDFKVEFYKFKQQHSNFSGNLDTLKKSISSFDSENSELISKNNELIEEVKTIKDKFVQLELENSGLYSKCDTINKQNNSLKQTIEEIENENKKNHDMISDKQVLIDRLGQENQSLATEVLKSDMIAKDVADLKQADIRNKEKIKTSKEFIADQNKEIALKDSIINETKKQLTELADSASMSEENQQVSENLRNELASIKSEIQQLTDENKLICNKHEKSIEELKTYKHKFKTLNNSWAQKFDKTMKSKDQGILDLQSELNAQNAKHSDISNDFNRKFLGSDIFEDKPRSNVQSKPDIKKDPLRSLNISKLDNKTNKTIVSNKNNYINKINTLDKVKKASKKKKNHKNTNKLQPI